MHFWKRAPSLPLGVDLGPESVSLVAAAAARDGFAVLAARTLDVPSTPAAHRDDKIVEAIRAMLMDFGTKERRCILGAPSDATVARTFRIPLGMRRREAGRAAALEADALVAWPRSERLVALDVIPGSEDRMLLSIARANAIERLVSVARAGGLKPVAVDVSACAWRRAIPNADAVLDCSSDRAELVIFGPALGSSHLFAPRLIEERLATHVRTAFVEARREGVADVQRLLILATRFRYEMLQELLRYDGYTVGPVLLGGIEGPTWGLAYGLATWSVATRGPVAP